MLLLGEVLGVSPALALDLSAFDTDVRTNITGLRCHLFDQVVPDGHQLAFTVPNPPVIRATHVNLRARQPQACQLEEVLLVLWRDMTQYVDVLTSPALGDFARPEQEEFEDDPSCKLRDVALDPVVDVEPLRERHLVAVCGLYRY